MGTHMYTHTHMEDCQDRQGHSVLFPLVGPKVGVQPESGGTCVPTLWAVHSRVGVRDPLFSGEPFHVQSAKPLFLCLCYSFVYQKSPGIAVSSQHFPCLKRDVALDERHPEAVLEAFQRPSWPPGSRCQL